MRDSYPSNISREEFESIQALFGQAKKKTRPRVIYLYDVLYATGQGEKTTFVIVDA